MQTEYSLPRRLLAFPVLLIALSLSVFTLTMCKNKKADQSTDAGMDGGSPASFSMKAIILDSATLKTWVANNWTKPNGIRLMIMQFISGNGASMNSNMFCLAYPAKKVSGAGSKGSIFLKTDPSSTTVTFTDSVIIANNCFDFTKDSLFNNDGSLNGFTHLRFTPKKNAQNFIIFEVQKFNKDGMVSAAMPTNPCPPCVYCPDGCTEEAFDE